MDHTAAISSWLTPVLLVVIAYYLKRFLERNERDHDEFYRRTNQHDIRLTRVETEMEHFRGEDGK